MTPDKYLPHRYAGASGDFNPIHIDPEFASRSACRQHPARALDDGPGRPRPHPGRRRRSSGAEAAFDPVPRHGVPRAGAGRHRHGQPSPTGPRRHRHGRRPRATTSSSGTPRQSWSAASNASGPRPVTPTIGVMLTERQQADPGRCRRRLRARWASRSARRRSPPRRDRWSPRRCGRSSPIARGAGLSDHPAYLSGPGADRLRLPLLRRRAARLPGSPPGGAAAEFSLTRMRREVDEAIRETTGALSRITDLVALVTAPPLRRRRSTGSRCCGFSPGW